MLSRRSQRRGQHSCRWSLLLLLGLLKLFEIAEALTLREMSTDISSVPMTETKVFSRTGDDVSLSVSLGLPLSGLSVIWSYLSQDGPRVMNSFFDDDYVFEPAAEYEQRTSLIITPEKVKLILKNVNLQDSGTYKCVQKNYQQSVESYVILQVTDSEEKDENSVVIYSMVGFLSVALVVWMISVIILCKRRDLRCPRIWGQDV